MKVLNQIFEGWESFVYAIQYRFGGDEYEIDFWEEISNGWYQEYIYPYDDLYIPTISVERKLRLDERPKTIYISEKDFDEFCQKLEEPLSPEILNRLEKLTNRPKPWDIDL